MIVSMQHTEVYMQIVANCTISPQTAKSSTSTDATQALAGWKANSILNDKIRYALLNELREHDSVRGVYLHKQLKIRYKMVIRDAMKGMGLSCASSENIYYKDSKGIVQHMKESTARRLLNELARKDLVTLERAYKHKKDGGGSAPTIAIPKDINGKSLHYDINQVRKRCRLERDGKPRRHRKVNPVGRPKKATKSGTKSLSVAPPLKLTTSVHQMNANSQVNRSERSYSNLIEPEPNVSEKVLAPSGPFCASSLCTNDLLKMVMAPSSRQDRIDQKAREKEQHKVKTYKPSTKDDYSDYNPFAVDTGDYSSSDSNTDPENDAYNKRIDKFAEKPKDLGVDPSIPIDAPIDLENITGFEELGMEKADLINLRQKFEYFGFKKDRIQINAQHAIYQIKTIQQENRIRRAKGDELLKEIKNRLGFLSDCIRHDKAQWLYEHNREQRMLWS